MDPSSESEFGQKWLTISDDLIVDDAQLKLIAQYWLEHGKEPKHRFNLSGLPFLAFLQPAASRAQATAARTTL